MNRFVSLLLATLCLTAVSLAQPAQAQWVQGMPYYSSSNSYSSQPGTTVTFTPTGHINITSTPTSGYPDYGTGGNYSGSVNRDYTWTGNSNPNGTSITMSQSVESTGTGGNASSGSSLAGAAYGSFSMYPGGWDQKPSVGSVTDVYGPGVTPPTTITQTVSLGGSISAHYNGPSQSTIATADVTFSATQQ